MNLRKATLEKAGSGKWRCVAVATVCKRLAPQKEADLFKGIRANSLIGLRSQEALGLEVGVDPNGIWVSEGNV